MHAKPDLRVLFKVEITGSGSVITAVTLSTMNKWCTVLSIVHLLCVSIATLTSSFVVESILGTGAACMIVAFVAVVPALICRRLWILGASAGTLLVGAFFIIFELIYYGFGGPDNAALPLAVLFLVVQYFALVATVADLNQRSTSDKPAQISLKQLLIASAIFGVSFGIIENFPTGSVPYISNSSVAFRFPWLISLSLAMFFLSISGLLLLRTPKTKFAKGDPPIR